MRFVDSFKQFITEKKEENFEDKIKGHGYYKGISTSTARAKDKQMKDQASKADLSFVYPLLLLQEQRINK